MGGRKIGRMNLFPARPGVEYRLRKVMASTDISDQDVTHCNSSNELCVILMATSFTMFFNAESVHGIAAISLHFYGCNKTGSRTG